MHPRLAVCHRPTDDLARTVELALECGDRAGVEITVDPEDGFTIAPLADALRREGLPVRYHLPLYGHGFSSADSDEASIAERAVSRLIGFVSDCGGSHLTVHAALPSGSREDDRFQRTAERLARLVDTGACSGVRICLENLRWGDTSDPFSFLALVESAGAGVTLDIGHASSSEAADLGFGAERFVKLMSPRIETAHVYEYEDHDGHHAPLGLEPMAHTLRALCETGCDWWTIELHDRDEAARACRLVRDFLDA